MIDLLSKLPVALLLLLSGLGVITGDYLGKVWSTNQKPLIYLLAMIGYFFSGFFYLPTLLKHGLVITSVVWSIINIIGFLVIGLVIFKEPLSTQQIIGVCLGVAALIILSF